MTEKPIRERDAGPWRALLAEFEKGRDCWTDAEVHQFILDYMPEIDAAIRDDEALRMGFGL